MNKHLTRPNLTSTVHTSVCNGQQFTPSDLVNGRVTDRLFFTTCPNCLKISNYSEQDKNRLVAKNIVYVWGKS